MRIIIHRGTHQIGGSCVELKTGDTRILLDFGMPLQDSLGADFDDRTVNNKSLQGLIGENVLFDIKGLYRDSQPSVDAVFISHSHKDHYGFLPYINPKIPIYLSKGAYELVRALNVFLPESKRTNIDAPTFLRHNRPVRIGGFSITPYLVDHSGFDAMGFLISETATGKTILYTGDFRAGGWTKKRYDDFINKPPARVDCLLMEGTMLARGAVSIRTSQRLFKVLSKLSKTARIRSFQSIALVRILTALFLYTKPRGKQGLYLWWIHIPHTCSK